MRRITAADEAQSQRTPQRRFCDKPTEVSDSLISLLSTRLASARASGEHFKREALWLDTFGPRTPPVIVCRDDCRRQILTVARSGQGLHASVSVSLCALRDDGVMSRDPLSMSASPFDSFAAATSRLFRYGTSVNVPCRADCWRKDGGCPALLSFERKLIVVALEDLARSSIDMNNPILFLACGGVSVAPVMSALVASLNDVAGSPFLLGIVTASL